MKNVTRKTSRRHGVALIWTAVIIVVLLGFIGFAVDFAYAFLTANQLQNAADAAALAGADVLPFSSSQAVTNATNTAASNNAAGASVILASGDVELGSYDRTTQTFTPGGGGSNAVRVTARRASGSPNGPLHLLFGPIFGVSTVDVSRQAVAINAPTPAMLMLDPSSGDAISVTGNGNINVTGGGAVMVDTSSSDSIEGSGSGSLTASAIYLHGNAQSSDAQHLSPTPVVNAGALSDPLALLAPPPKSPLPAGYFYVPGDLSAGVLQPGIYYVDGNINLQGNDVLDARAGCMIYLHQGTINMKGNSSLLINPPSSGPYAGISIYQDHNNTNGLNINGNVSISGTGILYFPRAAVSLGGNSSIAVNQLISGKVAVGGSAQMTINLNNTFLSRHQAFLVK
jgi:hypothetical protein